jgi:hypothetical protein
MHQQFNLLKHTGYVMHQQFNLLKRTGYVMHQKFNLLKPTGYVTYQQFNLLNLLLTRLVFITEMKSVYCAVRTLSLNKAVCASYLKG